MTIRDRRFDEAVNRILREELQKGNLPSSKEFIWRVNQYLQNTDLTKPSLKFTDVRKNGAALSNAYNKVLDDLYRDLETLYISAIEQQNLSLKHFNKFEVEKAKLDYQLKNEENRLKEIIMLYNGDGFLNTVYDIFVDMSKVDTSQTTASVDIARHEARINEIKQTSKKISAPATTAFEVSPNLAPAPQLETITGTTADAMNDKTNTIWQARVLTDASVSVPTYYHVMFNAPQDINRITLSLQTIKPTYVRVEATGDNINWFKLPYYENGVVVKDNYTFDFPNITVSRVRFMLAKDEPDNETLVKVDGQDKVKYSYLFGIKNVSFYTYTYSTESELYSTILDADPSSDTNFTINKVSLHTEEELPNGTDINYFIALPPTTGNPDWKAISPVNHTTPKFDQVIDFKNISTSVPNVFSIDPSISIGEYELENLYTHGIRFYKIGEIADRKIIDGSEKLFVGKNTWGVKYFDLQQADHATHLPSMEDWRSPQQVQITYNKIADGKPGLLLSQATTSTARNYMFTLGVYSSKAKDIATIIPASIDPITIYMNGEQVFQGIPNTSSKLNLLFKSGWNEIIVLCYTSKSTGTVNGATLDINFDPRSYGSSVYSQAQALQKVSIFDLRYNVMNTDYNKFALVEVNNKTQVIINNAIPGLEYEFYYDYIDGTVKDKILFRATLLRDNSVTQTSPKLKSYRLRFS